MTSMIGNVVFRVKKGDFTETLDWEALPLESRKRMAAYGAMRFVNDRVGGEEMVGEKLATAIAAVMAKVKSGDWSESRAGGVQLSPLAKEVRGILVAMLVRAGKKRADAEEVARNESAAVNELVGFIAGRDQRDDFATIEDDLKARIKAEAEKRLAAKDEVEL